MPRKVAGPLDRSVILRIHSKLWERARRLARYLAVAEQQDVSTSEIVRRALREYLAKHDPEKETNHG